MYCFNPFLGEGDLFGRLVILVDGRLKTTVCHTDRSLEVLLLRAQINVGLPC